MTSPIKTHCFGTVLLLSTLQFGIAQSDSNLLTFVFGPPATPVWDISGTYQITNHMQGAKLRPMEIVFHDIILSVDDKGKVGGAGTILTYAGDDYVGGDYKVSGKVSGGGEKTQVKFNVKFNGNGIVSDVSTTCKINAKYNLTVLPAVLAMGGKVTGNANFKQLGNGDLKSDIVLPLPPGADGGWIVKMDVYPYGRKISGSAMMLVNNIPTTTLATKVTGNVPSKSLVVKTKLSGYGNSSGAKLNLDFVPVYGATNLPSKVEGKILGQKVKN